MQGDTHPAQKQNRTANPQPLHPGQELVHIVGVTGETGHSGGQGQPVQLPGGEPVQALEQIVAQDQGNSPGADGGHAVCHNVRRDTQGGAEHHSPAGEKNAPPAAGGHHVIQNGLQKIGDQQLHQCPQKLDEHGQQHIAIVGAYVFAQARHILPSSSPGRFGLLPGPSASPGATPNCAAPPG